MSMALILEEMPLEQSEERKAQEVLKGVVMLSN